MEEISSLLLLKNGCRKSCWFLGLPVMVSGIDMAVRTEYWFEVTQAVP